MRNFMLIIFATEGDSPKSLLKKIDGLEGPKIDKKMVKIYFALKMLLNKNIEYKKPKIGSYFGFFQNR